MVWVMPDSGKHSPTKKISIAVHPGKIAILPNSCFSPNNGVGTKMVPCQFWSLFESTRISTKFLKKVSLKDSTKTLAQKNNFFVDLIDERSLG